MGTRIYGASDDLVEAMGDVRGEVCHYGTDEQERGILLICSDGTLLEAKYGKPDNGAIWAIRLIKRGDLFQAINVCTDEDADLGNTSGGIPSYSDVAKFGDGLKWIYAANGEWGPMK